MVLRSLIFKSIKSVRVYLLDFQRSAAGPQMGAAEMVRTTQRCCIREAIWLIFGKFLRFDPRYWFSA
jgi:hypothetical protein